MWDYVIVGAGTAGSVLAHQLTESGRNRVLIVEAGGKPPLAARIPGGFVKLFRSQADWAFESEPQAGCGGRVVFTPRGRMLGGSANINAQIHQWGHPADFDGWQRLGATGWSWDAVRPLFRAMECWAGEDADGQSRGRLGPMAIARPPRTHPIAEAFVAAARAAGLDSKGGYNGLGYRGAYLCELAHRKGRRFSAYDAYLRPALRRPNLAVRSGHAATRLLLEQGRAVGVALDDGSVERAGRGIVLAAGAFGSPHLLMLSGIGDAPALKAHGIEAVRHSPGVGANLQDHPLSGIKFAMRRPISMKAADNLGALLQWLVLRRGLLTSNAVEAFAFDHVLDRDAPDLELLIGAVEWKNQALDPPDVHAFTIGSIPVAPRSRGSVTLRSPDPKDAPRIDFALLTDADGADAKVLLAGLRLARRIAATDPLSSETLGEMSPSAEAHSDEALLAYAKSEIQTVYHPCGTCRMGADKGAPVRPDLRVRGIDGLWIADASVMPTVPRGHPNAAVAMIAERGSKLIAQATG